jgi:hypothetical protein
MNRRLEKRSQASFRHLSAGLVVIAAVVVAGCGSSSSGNASGQVIPTNSFGAPVATALQPTTGPGGCTASPVSDGGNGPKLTTCYQVSGAVSGSGGFIGYPPVTNCADYVKGLFGTIDHEQFIDLPSPLSKDVTVGGHTLNTGLAISPYSGPGSYTSSDATNSTTVGSTRYSNNFGSGFTFHATVKSDGSGSVTASNLGATTGSGSISITETWVCTN